MNSQDMTLYQIIEDVVKDIPQKLTLTLSNWVGVALSAFFAFCGAWLGDRLPLLGYIGVAILIDAIWGIITSRRAGKFIFSRLLSKSGVKIGAYVSLYAIVALAEKSFGEGEFMLTSSVLAGVFIASEGLSILAHISIIAPDWSIIKLLRKVLKGEIAKKLGISEEEVDSIWSEKKEEKNFKRKRRNETK